MNVDFQEQDIIIEFTPEGQDGKSIRPRGDWSATAQYVELDLVSYQGSTYIAQKIVPVGTLPTDTEYWMINASNETPYWGTIAGTLSDQTDLQNALDAKANANEVYTKTETDTLLAEKADTDDVYTKSETDDLLDLKANAADVYTQTELDGIFDGIDNALTTKADKTDVYTKTETNNLLSGKADSDDVYTKSETYSKAEVDTALNAKADSADVYNKTETDNLLSLKANSADVYSKAETDTLLNNKADVGESYTKAEEDALLAVKANSADVYTKTQTDTLLASKADADTVYTKTETDSLLALKANSADVYTKTATDALLLDKAPVILNSASGSIASFSDGSPAPVTALSVGIEPIQDLHGYDNPWPAGGGKNLADPSKLIDNYYLNQTGGTASREGSVITDYMTFDFSEGMWIYINSFPSNGSANGRICIYNAEKSLIYTSTTQSGDLSREITAEIMANNPVYLRAGYYTIGQKDTFYIGLTEVSSFQPYSNICPITGHSTATVTRTGKNLLNPSLLVVGTFRPTTGEQRFDVNNRVCTLGMFFVKSGTYTFSVTSNQQIVIYVYDTDGTFLPSESLTNWDDYKKRTITLTGDRKISAGYRFTNDGVITVADVVNPQLELGSSATPYEPYQAQSVTIDLDGTRYGGVLNLLTGEMTVDRAIVDLGTLGWSYSADWNGLPVFFSSDLYSAKRPANDNSKCNLISSMYKNLTRNELYNLNGYGMALLSGGGFRVRNFAYSDAASFKTAMSGVQLVYELATPLTVQLSPSQLMQTLLGQNHLWSDTGDTSVEYRADTRLFIEGLTKPTEDDMIANTNIASGKYFMVGNSLYLSTASIAQGDTIVPGTNCTPTSLAEALNAINA